PDFVSNAKAYYEQNGGGDFAGWGRVDENDLPEPAKLLLARTRTAVGQNGEVEVWTTDAFAEEDFDDQLYVISAAVRDFGEEASLLDYTGKLVARGNDSDAEDWHWVGVDEAFAQAAKTRYESDGGGDFGGWARVHASDLTPAAKTSYEGFVRQNRG